MPPQTTRRWSGRRWQIAREVAIVGLGVFLYFYVRGQMHAMTTVAVAHSLRIIELEQELGLFHEPAMQRRIMDHGWMVTLQNWIYIFGHWPVVIGTLIWLVWRHPDYFGRWRNAMIISGLIGIAIFAAYPVAPPRLVSGYGFFDSVTARSNAYRVLQPPSLTNPYAAVPSLHFGWNLLMGIAWVRLSHHWAGKVFGILMPPLMFLAIILTANHFIFDGIAGGILALFGLVVAFLLHREPPSPQRAGAPCPPGDRPRSVPDLHHAPNRAPDIPDRRPAQETHGTAAPPSA
jgi:hypothetical protein